MDRSVGYARNLKGIWHLDLLAWEYVQQFRCQIPFKFCAYMGMPKMQRGRNPAILSAENCEADEEFPFIHLIHPGTDADGICRNLFCGESPNSRPHISKKLETPRNLETSAVKTEGSCRGWLQKRSVLNAAISRSLHNISAAQMPGYVCND